MDPVSALGAASAAIQFFDFVSKLLTKSFEVYASSSELTGEHEDLQIITENLTSYNQALISAAGGVGNAEISSLCQSCNQVTENLMDVLKKLQKKKWTHWENFCIVLRTIWSEREITSLRERVNGYRQQISFQILLHIQ
jgi:uncharacterized protein YukE